MKEIRQIHRRLHIELIHAPAARPWGHAAALLGRSLNIRSESRTLKDSRDYSGQAVLPLLDQVKNVTSFPEGVKVVR